MLYDGAFGVTDSDKATVTMNLGHDTGDKIHEYTHAATVEPKTGRVAPQILKAHTIHTDINPDLNIIQKSFV